MDVSIIIVNYNTRGLLRDCIKSIKEKTAEVDYEIIVVDNASSDGSMKMLAEDFPEVRAFSSGGNIGFGRANNIGMKEAEGKYLFLLNSDTLLVNNAIKIFYNEAERRVKSGRKIGAIGSILIGADGKTCHSYGKFITPFEEIKETIAKYLRFLKDPENTCPTKIQGEKKVDYVTGADMLVPRKTFEDIGGFDPDFFMYCEEVDWQKRMEEKGYERLLVAGPGIIHLEGGSEISKKSLWSPRRLYNLYTSRSIYRRKHYSKHILPIFTVFRRIIDAPSILLTSLMSGDKSYMCLLKI